MYVTIKYGFVGTMVTFKHVQILLCCKTNCGGEQSFSSHKSILHQVTYLLKSSNTSSLVLNEICASSTRGTWSEQAVEEDDLTSETVEERYALTTAMVKPIYFYEHDIDFVIYFALLFWDIL